MDYKKRIIELIKSYQKNINVNDKIELLDNIINTLTLSLNDFNSLKQLSEYNLNLIDNPILKKQLIILSKIPKRNKNVDNNEIINFIEKTKNQMIKEKEICLNLINEINSLINATNDLNYDNAELLNKFISGLFKNNEIGFSESLNLTLFITKEALQMNSINDIEIIENETPLDNLELIFTNYGYSFNLIPKKEQDLIKKYAKEYNINYILGLLNHCHISNDIFASKCKQITELIVFFNKDSIKIIENFINNNNCTLDYLLSIPSIFFSRKRDFVFKPRKNNIGTIDYLPEFKKPKGSQEDFLYCIEIIRQLKGLSKDYKLTNDDLQTRKDGKGLNTFILTPRKVIEKNINILKRYNLIDGDNIPDSITALMGNHTEYLLDRSIESEILEYIKNNMSFLYSEDNFPFKWYKIKRALDTNQGIYHDNNINRGLKSILRNDVNSFDGIYLDNNKRIIQSPMSMENLARVPRINPILLKKYNNPDILAEEEFKHFYVYHIFNPIQIYKHVGKSDNNNLSEQGFKIEQAFNDDYHEYNYSLNDAENDSIIQMLDNLKLPLNINELYPIKKDNLSYVFYSFQNNNWPSERIVISRPKVLRLCLLLKQKGLWINDSMNTVEKTNLILSVLVKDSIISFNQLNVLRNIINEKLLIKERNEVIHI